MLGSAATLARPAEEVAFLEDLPERERDAANAGEALSTGADEFGEHVLREQRGAVPVRGGGAEGRAWGGTREGGTRTAGRRR